MFDLDQLEVAETLLRDVQGGKARPAPSRERAQAKALTQPSDGAVRGGCPFHQTVEAR